MIALATMMLVWFGVQESLASAQGGPGFNMGKFISLFMLLTFAYAMVNFYDSASLDRDSLKGFIDGGTANLVNVIGADGIDDHVETDLPARHLEAGRRC